MRSYLVIAALLCSGCLLETEPCGLDFIARDGECVPKQTPSQYGDDSDAVDVGVLPDVQKADIGQRLVPLLDATVPDSNTVDQGVEVDEWSAYSVVLVVDRSPDDSAGDTPAVPGADIDAIEVYNSSDRRIAVANRVIDARINDPYDVSIQTRPMSALGPADDLAVSLGTQGGFIRVELAGERPLLRNDQLMVTEIEDLRGNQDSYEVFLCRSDSEGLAGCRSMGNGATGETLFPLE